MKKILITGAAGQLGTDLALDLANKWPDSQILLTDIKPEAPETLQGLAYQPLDVLDSKAAEALLAAYQPDEIYHLAALLSGTGEKNPALAWALNLNAYKHLLDICVAHVPAVKLFFPSSIAVFGPGAGKVAAQHGYLDPTSMYGITKMAGEQLSNYYNSRYGLDVRSLRFPGLISAKAHPGGGTTDYSVEIFLAAVQNQPYTCYLASETGLPFMYMPDALAAIHGLMAAPSPAISVRTSYNIHGFAATPQQFAQAIEAHLGHPIPIKYEPDFRQAIADSWPTSLDDAAARTDWQWAPTYDIPAVVADMFDLLAQKQPLA